MILLAVGTESFSFHRLVRAVDEAAPRLGVRVFGQVGSSTYEPRAIEFERLVPFERMRALIEEADRVVCHAGAGTTLLAVSLGHRPVVLPRRARHGEHVDDHQVAFAERLAERGLVLLAREADEVVELLARAPRRGAAPPTGNGEGGALARHLLASVGLAQGRRAAA